VPRFPLAVPADITLVRSGIPYSIPGRSVSLGERGLGVVLAGEVRPGDSVDLSFSLPDFGGRLQLKAVVRYQALLQCGLEFEPLTPQQQKLIEYWTRTKSVTNPGAAAPAESTFDSRPSAPGAISVPPAAIHDQKILNPRFRRALWLVLAGFLVIAALSWWHWRRVWDDLESGIPATKPLSQPPPAYVPAEVMERLVTHKVDPVYPEAARQANVQGVVILDAVIGQDGTVVHLHPVSGPEELTSAAMDAVKWWRFQPYQINGRAQQVETKLAVDFR
jgi:TonB family protein